MIGIGQFGTTSPGTFRVAGTPAPLVAPTDLPPAPGFPPAFGPPRRSTDVSLLDDLTDLVALEYNVSSTGGPGPRFGDKGDQGRWLPIPGYEQVRCRVALMPPEPVEGAAQSQWVTPAIVTFGAAISADTRHRIIYNHPTLGPMPLYFRGPVKEQQGAHHWTGYCQNREV